MNECHFFPSPSAPLPPFLPTYLELGKRHSVQHDLPPFRGRLAGKGDVHHALERLLRELGQVQVDVWREIMREGEREESEEKGGCVARIGTNIKACFK